MKKILMIMISLTLVLSLAACGGGSGKSKGEINIAGSTSVQPLSEELGNAYTDKTGVVVNVAGGGSSAGVKAAADGTADIGAASRELKQEEGLVKSTTIALDGIAIIVNSENGVANLSQDQLKQIYIGEITNWKEVGGKDAPITVISREDGSGTRDAFDEKILGKDVEITSDAVIQNSTGAVKIAVNSDPNAIGYASLGSVLTDDTVKAVTVDGIEASIATVQDGTYPISRPFNYLTKGEPKGAVKEFIDWVLSDEGQKIVANEFIPLKK